VRSVSRSPRPPARPRPSPVSDQIVGVEAVCVDREARPRPTPRRTGPAKRKHGEGWCSAVTSSTTAVADKVKIVLEPGGVALVVGSSVVRSRGGSSRNVGAPTMPTNRKQCPGRHPRPTSPAQGRTRTSVSGSVRQLRDGAPAQRNLFGGSRVQLSTAFVAPRRARSFRAI
jgi:hypothetical protein